MKNLGTYLVWVLVASGLLWGYEGLTDQDLLEQVFGLQVENIIDMVIGVCGLLVGYKLLAGKLTVKGK